MELVDWLKGSSRTAEDANAEIAKHSEFEKIAWYYENKLPEGGELDYIRTRPFDDLQGRERSQAIRWLRSLAAGIEPWWPQRILWSIGIGDRKDDMWSKSDLSEEIARRLGKLAECKSASVDTQSCPRSYEVSCTYKNSRGNTRTLKPFTKFVNCK